MVMFEEGSLLVAKAETYISSEVGGDRLLPVAPGTLALVRAVEGGWYRIFGGWVASESDGVALWESATTYEEAMQVDPAFLACMAYPCAWEIPRHIFPHIGGGRLSAAQRQVALYLIWRQADVARIDMPVLQRLYFYAVLRWGHTMANVWLKDHYTVPSYIATLLHNALGANKALTYVEQIAILLK